MNTKTHTTDVRTRLRAAWAAELDAARAARSTGDTSAEWTHLERAHKYPVGNTGGADVSAFRPMPIPDDLRAALEQEEPSAMSA